jgi:hypothetical protein
MEFRDLQSRDLMLELMTMKKSLNPSYRGKAEKVIDSSLDDSRTTILHKTALVSKLSTILIRKKSDITWSFISPFTKCNDKIKVLATPCM